MKIKTKRWIGYGCIILVCSFYWILDSIWSYVSFEYNLRNMIFRTPVSYVDTVLLQVPPYQAVSRSMVVSIFVVLGIIIVEFLRKIQESQQKQQEAHDTFLTVLNSIDASIYVTDIKTYEILFMNKYLVDNFGENFAGRTCFSVLKSSDKICEYCPVNNLIDENGNLKDVIIRELQNQITKEWYIHYDRAIKWTDGRTVHLQIATNVTLLKNLQDDKKKAEEYIKQSQKMESIGHLAGGIAHDFNNLLFPIIGMSERLLEELPEKSDQYSYAEIIMKAGKRGRDLVKQILSISRKGETEMVPVGIQKILIESLTLSRSTIPQSITVKTDIQKDCGWVMADPTQIHQVIMNLITNAYHAIGNDKHGLITIELKELLKTDKFLSNKLKPENKYVMLKVQDNGCGIDDAIKDKIFDPYFTTKEKGKGTGLGLAVVYGIVRDHGGDISLESIVGEGSSFYVYFPILKKIPKIKKKNSLLPMNSSSKHVLLVDDEEAVAITEKNILTKLGYKITMYTDSNEALKRFSENPNEFDLLFTDVNMPSLNGINLAMEVLKIRPNFPIVLCTGFIKSLNKQELEKLGIKGFIMKPFATDDLSYTISHILDEVA